MRRLHPLTRHGAASHAAGRAGAPSRVTRCAGSPGLWILLACACSCTEDLPESSEFASEAKDAKADSAVDVGVDSAADSAADGADDTILKDTALCATDQPCDDGDPCTVDDVCKGGQCLPGKQKACDDDKPCTDDGCDDKTGGCKHVANTAACDDGNLCTKDDGCSGGKCVGDEVGCQCQTTADCADDEDGNLCNGTLFCDQGALPWTCKVDPATVVLPCPTTDDTACRFNHCEAAVGNCVLVDEKNGTACDDGDACTMKEECNGGQCVGGKPKACDDDNICTEDACDVAKGCTFTPATGPCNDGSECTTVDNCKEGKCAGGPPSDCDDGNVCTIDGCNPDKGCTELPGAATCTDGDECTVDDSCKVGACKAGPALACEDGSPCIKDGCNAAEGCTYTPLSGEIPCTDNNPCTLKDLCDKGECKGGEPKICDDGNACTKDACEPAVGCQATNDDGVSCDDTLDCTVASKCSAGKCAGGVNALFGKSFGDPAKWEAGRAIAAAADGGMFVLGHSGQKNFTAGAELTVWSISRAGEIKWTYVLPTVAKGDRDSGAAVIGLPDGGAVFMGQRAASKNGVSSKGVVAVRLDASGKPAWSSPKTLGSGSCRPRLQPIVRLKKGDLAYAATRWDGKKWRCELARFQPDGKLLWLKGHAAGAWCQSFAMTLTADDKIAVGSGTVAVGGKSFDVRISLHDGLGNLLAEHTVESAGSRFPKALHPLPGGAFRVAALEHVPDTSLYVPRLLVISAAGIQLEDVEVKSGLALLGGELVALADGGFLYAGGSQESKASQAARVARVAPGGTVRWIAPLFPSTYARDVALLDDGTIATMGNEWGKTLTGQLRLAVLDLWGHSKCSEDGGCMSKTVKDCDDGKLCTNVTCKTGKGCDNPELTGPCSDGLACSAPGQCVGGQCKGVGSALYDMATSPYPGPLGHYTSVNPSPDGGVVVCGHIDGGPGKAYTGLIEAYGPTGKNSWSKLYTDVKHRYSFWDVTRLANGGTVAVGQDGFGSGGTAQYNALLVYFDADGKELSQDIYQNKGHSMAYQAVTTVGGDELVVVATALKTGTSDSWTAIHQRLKPMGGIVWSFNDQHQRLLDVAPHPAGGFAAAGIYRKADGQKPALSMALARRFGEDGKSLWGNAFSDDGGGSRTLHALDVTPDGDLIGAGRQWTGKSSRMLLVAISAAGKELWFKTLGNASPGGATGIVKASDGYLLLGMDDKALDGKPGALMIRTDLAGAAIWQKAYGVGSADKVYRMAPMPGGGVAFVGGTKLGDVRPWIVRTDAWGHNACSKAGKCAAPSTPLCDDANPCTWDGCDTKKGCTHGPATEGLTCADGKTCTKGVCSKP